MRKTDESVRLLDRPKRKVWEEKLIRTLDALGTILAPEMPSQ